MIYPSWTLYGTNMHNTEHNKGVADREHQSQTALERIGSQLVRVCSTCRTVGYHHNTFVWHAVCWHQFGIRARAFCAKLNWTAESYRSIMAPCCSTASCKNIKDGFFFTTKDGGYWKLGCERDRRTSCGDWRLASAAASLFIFCPIIPGRTVARHLSLLPDLSPFLP